jgi:hypothetical protein
MPHRATWEPEPNEEAGAMGDRLCSTKPVGYSLVPRKLWLACWRFGVDGVAQVVEHLPGKTEALRGGGLAGGLSKWEQDKEDRTAVSLSETLSGFVCLLFSFLCYWGLNSGPSLWATPPALFCVEYYQDNADRVSWTICLGWLQTAILLISASWVAGITGVSHQHPADPLCFARQDSAWYQVLFQLLCHREEQGKKYHLFQSKSSSFIL